MELAILSLSGDERAILLMAEAVQLAYGGIIPSDPVYSERLVEKCVKEFTPVILEVCAAHSTIGEVEQHVQHFRQQLRAALDLLKRQQLLEWAS